MGGSDPPQDDTLDLKSGWNFVSTPKRLASGSDTAAVFAPPAPTSGHSVLTYDADGWRHSARKTGFRCLTVSGSIPRQMHP
ncbi:hypothetical protein, partial [Methanogenium cariaci]|uniref:hypothetical protein n=1 Tax=Methanogenium cariaci TaxID=2197 RepID=UPI0012F6E53E